MRGKASGSKVGEASWEWRVKVVKVLVSHCKVLALHFQQENDKLENVCHLEWTLTGGGGLLKRMEEGPSRLRE